MRTIAFLAKDLARHIDRKDLTRFEGHAIAVSRLRIHGILSDAESRKCNDRIVKMIRQKLRKKGNKHNPQPRKD